MSDEGKNSNLIIFGLGIVAMFFAYLIYSKSKETTTQPTLSPLSLHPDFYNQYQQYQPYQPPLQCPPPQIIQFPQPYQNQQPQTQVELYKISEQLKLQSEQIKSIQEQQSMHTYNIDQIENTKCSNVVSMGNPKLQSLKIPSNVGRENEEYIANTVFGMK